MSLETVSISKSHGGVQGVYRHRSTATGTDMTFAVFTPRQPGPRPVVTFLSGLTCTHANVMEKGEYRRAAAELGLVVVCPDTSPRGEGTPDDPAYDLGQGAGFYLDATEDPWAERYRMETYVARELPALVAEHFPVDPSAHGLSGHSMGGHGALTLALRNPGIWRSVSAFAPIVNPAAVPWGRKAFHAYLGHDERRWREHDAVSLIADGRRLDHLLVDVGTADSFLERELTPERLETVCADTSHPLTLRRQDGYDHSYFFISTFMAEHLGWHAARLRV